MAQADGFLGGEAFAVGGEVAHPPDGPGSDRRGIEHGEVGPPAFAHVAAVDEPEHVGGLAGELAHRAFDRHHLTVAHPPAEEVERQRSVAQLTDVRAGIGEPERDLRVGQEVTYRAVVVVGDVDAKAGVQVFGQRDLADHVER